MVVVAEGHALPSASVQTLIASRKVRDFMKNRKLINVSLSLGPAGEKFSQRKSKALTGNGCRRKKDVYGYLTHTSPMNMVEYMGISLKELVLTLQTRRIGTRRIMDKSIVILRGALVESMEQEIGNGFWHDEGYCEFVLIENCIIGLPTPEDVPTMRSYSDATRLYVQPHFAKLKEIEATLTPIYTDEY